MAKGAMHGKITEKDPNFEKEDTCKCEGLCKTRSCSCFKIGSGCNPSCACSASCKNIFNNLNYFFGETKKCDANPCFAKWLIKNGNNENALNSVNRDKLQKRIMESDSYVDLLDVDDEYGDDDFIKWRKDWDKITDADEKLKHTQKFFRMILSNDLDEASLYFYSFCQNDVFNNDNAWHCITCGSCQEWREWHCCQCDKCVYGMTCKGCGGKSEVSASGFF